jgi:hypothetical protein
MRPKKPTDLSLAPVAAEIDLNLQRLRDKSTAEEIEYELVLETNRSRLKGTREEAEGRLLDYALHNVDLHGWDAKISEDGSRICLSGGSVSLDVGLSAAILRYVEAAAGGDLEGSRPE